jgi:hypothetical protein
MLADSSNDVQAGTLDRDIHLPCTAKLELVDFIAKELPAWRDHPDRPPRRAETVLTEHLCDHLNGVTYRSSVWSHIQFRTETADETRGGRKIDLAVKPRGVAIITEGRRHSQFDALFPIECKRLPTPAEKDRDEREYVITKYGTTGGIQRFKFGYYGATHKFAAMIAYVQERAFSDWLSQINSWINDLSTELDSAWSKSDSLHEIGGDTLVGICMLDSRHARPEGMTDCELRHVWISMN